MRVSIPFANVGRSAVSRGEIAVQSGCPRRMYLRAQHLLLWLSLSALLPLAAGAQDHAVPNRALAVVDVNSNTYPKDFQGAHEKLLSGGYIVRITGGTEKYLRMALGLKFGAPVSAKADPTPTETAAGHSLEAISNAANPNAVTLILRGVAAYRAGNGSFHSVESYGPADQPDNPARGWRKQLDAWVAKEQVNAASGQTSQTQQPPSGAWTLLYARTIQSSDEYGNAEQNTIQAYRLNTTDTKTDHYMVFSSPQSEPAWNGNCNGFDECDMHTIGRLFWTGPSSGNLTEHGPTGTITSSSGGFDIGASLTASPGVSAGFSSSWMQPSVTTTDLSSGVRAKWDENIYIAHYSSVCNPAGGDLPIVSTGTYYSQQGAIFSVPAGQGLNIPVHDQATFCKWQSDIPIGPYYSTVVNDVSLTLSPPVLSVYPSVATTIAAGTSLPILVSAFVPESAESLAWTITSNMPSWLSVPSTGPFSGNQIIPASVAPGTPDGLSAYISVDSSPVFAAPAVRGGPLEIKVTVGKPVAAPASVLLTGGFDSLGNVALTALYDPINNKILPTGQPVLARAAHTATLLQTGDILIAGGTETNNINAVALAEAEVYHPSTGTFSVVGSMSTARIDHTASLLPDGKVLMTGGYDGANFIGTAEVYDPTTARFTSTGSLQTARNGHSATVISAPSQPTQVLIYGGFSGGASTTIPWEIWDERSGTFTQGSPTSSVIGRPPAAALPDGRLDNVGGVAVDFSTYPVAEELLTLGTGPIFAPGFDLQIGRQYHTLTALEDGTLLVTGGRSASGDQATVEVRNSNGWSLLSGQAACPGSVGCMVAAREGQTATLLPSGEVFVTGGRGPSGVPLASSELFDPITKTFTPGPTSFERVQHTATLYTTTTTALVTSPSRSASGQSVTLSATVVSPFSKLGGTVTFLDGSTVLRIVKVTDSSATYTTSNFSVGSHSLTALYSGDGTSGPSTSPAITQVVGKRATTTLLSSSLNSSNVGQKVTFTAKVSELAGGALTGTVTFNDGSTSLGPSTLLNGVATLTVSSLSRGTHPITASYGGDGEHDASVSTVVNQVVTYRDTTITLTSSATQTTYGQGITFTAVIKGTGGTPAGGQVNFTDGGTLLKQANISAGMATLTTQTLVAGSHTITAEYSGTQRFNGSRSEPVTIAVSQAAPTIAMGSSINPSNPGQGVRFTARVQFTPPSAAPTGTAQFLDGTTPLQSATLTHGAANISTAALSIGEHSISATYSGDSNYLSGTSNVLVQHVDGYPTTTILHSKPNPSTAGQTVQFTAQVVSRKGTPAGTVKFLDGTTQIGIGTLNSNGVARFITAALPARAHTITAAYAAQGGFAGSTTVLTQTVTEQVTVQVTLQSSVHPSSLGQPVVLTAEVTSNLGTPSGTVVFRNGNTNLGTRTLVNGAASLLTAALPLGTANLTANYLGDSTHQATTSLILPQQVNKADSTVAFATAPNPSNAGQTINVMALVTSNGGPVLKGLVIFNDGITPVATKALIDGNATFNTSALTPGTHSLTASFVGNATTNGSTSVAVVQTVNGKFPSTIALVPRPNPSTFGQTVVFTATVTSTGAGIPTGSVTVSEGATVYGSARVANGVATIPLSTLPVGLHILYGTYGGDNTHTGATSSSVQQGVR